MTGCVEPKPMPVCFTPTNTANAPVTLLEHVLYEGNQSIGQAYTTFDDTANVLDLATYLGGGTITPGYCTTEQIANEFAWHAACDNQTCKTVYFQANYDSNGEFVYPGGATSPVYYREPEATTVSAPVWVSTHDCSQPIPVKDSFVIPLNGGAMDQSVAGSVGTFTADEIDQQYVNAIVEYLDEGCIVELNGRTATTTGLGAFGDVGVIGGPGWDGTYPSSTQEWSIDTDYSATDPLCTGTAIPNVYAASDPGGFGAGSENRIIATVYCYKTLATPAGGPLSPQPTDVSYGECNCSNQPGSSCFTPMYVTDGCPTDSLDSDVITNATAAASQPANTREVTIQNYSAATLEIGTNYGPQTVGPNGEIEIRVSKCDMPITFTGNTIINGTFGASDFIIYNYRVIT